MVNIEKGILVLKKIKKIKAKLKKLFRKCNVFKI